jgi:hypothetical protein
MNKNVILVIVSLLVLCFANSALAFGDWKNGKQLYQRECTNCHQRNGEAHLLKLHRVTVDRWIGFCRSETTRKHVELLDQLTVAQKQDLLQYLLKYAKENDPTIYS